MMQTGNQTLDHHLQTTQQFIPAGSPKSLPPLPLSTDYRYSIPAIEQLIREKSAGRPLRILEAGCGARWPLKLQDVEYRLTAVDIDEEALQVRKTKVRDVDDVHVGDLRTTDLFAPASFDVIYNSYVLEHIDGAEHVLDNFLRWLTPGGLLVLRIPDRDSVYGFVTRWTPFWVHVFFKRHMMRLPASPGNGPYPTYYDRVVSRAGIHAFCEQHGCRIRHEAGYAGYFPPGRIYGALTRMVVRLISSLSLGRLDWRHNNLTFVIERLPGESAHGPAVKASAVAMAAE